jgi:hypothetical protein
MPRLDLPAKIGTLRGLEDAIGAPALIEVPCGPMPDPFRFIEMPKVRGA